MPCQFGSDELKMPMEHLIFAGLGTWTGVFAVSTAAEFFIMAALAGVVMGGSQAPVGSGRWSSASRCK